MMIKTLSDYTKINFDLDTIAQKISEYEGFPGINSNQDPCFSSDEDGFENCIYNKAGQLVWGYTVILTQEGNKLNVLIQIFDSKFEHVSDVNMKYDLDDDFEFIRKDIALWIRFEGKTLYNKEWTEILKEM